MDNPVLFHDYQLLAESENFPIYYVLCKYLTYMRPQEQNKIFVYPFEVILLTFISNWKYRAQFQTV